jgi:hypothetical protein
VTDDELIAVARAAAAERGRYAPDDARITRGGAEAAVLLSGSAYARSVGHLLIIDPASGGVLPVVPSCRRRRGDGHEQRRKHQRPCAAS